MKFTQVEFSFTPKSHVEVRSLPQSSTSVKRVVQAQVRSLIALTSLWVLFTNGIQTAVGQNQGASPDSYGNEKTSSVRNILQDKDGRYGTIEERVGDFDGLSLRVESIKPIHIAMSGPWLRADETTFLAQPLHHFEKFVAESWIVTAATGTKMEHTWKWGPAKNSIERWTEGHDAQGNPWTELVIYYWHPQDKKIHFLGMSPFQSGINRGTVQFNGESATFDSTLTQEELGKRLMRTRWTFKSANHYVETLFEKEASGKFVELVAFDHYRSQPAKKTVATKQKPSEIPPQFKGLKFLDGEPWHSTTEEGTQLNFDWSLSWIPIANICYGVVRESLQRNMQDHTHFFIYRERDFKSLRILALCANSDVITGDLEFTSSGGVRFELERNSSSATKKIASAIEAVSEVHLRQTVKVLDSANAPEAMAVHHKR